MKFSTPPTSSAVKKALLGLALTFAVLGGAIWYCLNILYTPIPALDVDRVFEVRPGSSLSRVSDELQSEGYLQHPLLFKALARWRGVENAIKAGEFQLRAGQSPEQMLSTLVYGDTIQYRVTLVEGWTFRAALDAIWKSEKVLRTLTELDLPEIAELLGIEQENPEGLLFPDTYFYPAGTSDLQLLKRAHERLNTILEQSWASRLGALPYDNSYEALIIASIIEKESAFGAERGHIAGVFVRRLERGMRLQSDPTVIYGMGNMFTGNLTRNDLTTETPYNTYRIAALPPTPIALAGLESIAASLNPLPSDYLYFVARGNGEHFFSSTLEEHNAAVRQFQIQATGQ